MILMPMFSPTHASAPSGVIMVAGEIEAGPGFFVAGYSRGAPTPDIGSISAEPLIGETLMALVHVPGFNQSQLIYEGEIAASLSLLTLYVNDVAFSLSEAENVDGITDVSWYDNTGPILEPGTYNIRIE